MVSWGTIAQSGNYYPSSAVIDHVEGMSAALGFVIINPDYVPEKPANISIKDGIVKSSD